MAPSLSIASRHAPNHNLWILPLSSNPALLPALCTRFNPFVCESPLLQHCTIWLGSPLLFMSRNQLGWKWKKSASPFPAHSFTYPALIVQRPVDRLLIVLDVLHNRCHCCERRKVFRPRLAKVDPAAVRTTNRKTTFSAAHTHLHTRRRIVVRFLSLAVRWKLTEQSATSIRKADGRRHLPQEQ